MAFHQKDTKQVIPTIQSLLCLQINIIAGIHYYLMSYITYMCEIEAISL